jgi:hypothetical protein
MRLPILLFALGAIAIPLQSGTSGLAQTTALEACINAYNCEVIQTSNTTWHPQFVNGTAPRDLPKEKRDLIKRQTVAATRLTIGQSGTFFGTVNPCAAYNYAYYPCDNTGCDPNTPATYSSNYVEQLGNAGALLYGYISIAADGQYYDPEQRDGIIAAMVAAASFGQEWSEAQYETPTNCNSREESCEYHTLWQGTGVGYIGAAIYDSSGAMLGWMQVTPTFVEPQNAFNCNSYISAISSGISTLDPVWSAVLGVISAVCDL